MKIGFGSKISLVGVGYFGLIALVVWVCLVQPPVAWGQDAKAAPLVAGAPAPAPAPITKPLPPALTGAYWKALAQHQPVEAKFQQTMNAVNSAVADMAKACGDGWQVGADGDGEVVCKVVVAPAAAPPPPQAAPAPTK